MNMRAPLLHERAERSTVTFQSLCALLELVRTAEQLHATGAWDDWDGVVISQWREIARRRIHQAFEDVTRDNT
jgi:hypothetical protein